ncbi:MAG: divergent polysaccharide deacetylase family protein [Rhodospirillaceae bacterium]
MDWKQAKATPGASFWPVPAGILAGIVLLLAVAAPEPGPSAPGADAAGPSAPSVETDSRVPATAMGPPRPGPPGILLPPRPAAADLTRRIENGIAPEMPEMPEMPEAASPESIRPGPAAEAGRAAAPPIRPRIAVVIDDMGFDRVQSARAVRLPAGVTLAYLPSAPDVVAQVRRARLAGHQIMLHLPMEANGQGGKRSRDVLSVLDDEAVLRENLERMLGRFGGYVGVNNHMGSRFTSDRGRMDIVLAELKRRGLFFVDSRTSGRSVVPAAASDMGIEFAVRDVFLDHDPDPAAIRARIAETEETALAAGQAIAIGHPRGTTMDLVAPWLKDIEARGFDLVPVSQLLIRPDGKRLARHQAAE